MPSVNVSTVPEPVPGTLCPWCNLGMGLFTEGPFKHLHTNRYRCRWIRPGSAEDNPLARDYAPPVWEEL